MKRLLFTALLACSASSFMCFGCGNDFASPSQVDSLRVFGVKTRVRTEGTEGTADFADVASGAPGARVRLELLGADGAIPPGGSARPLQVAWFSGCNNPPTRQFYVCYPLLNAVSSLIDPELVSPSNAGIAPEIFSANSAVDLAAPSLTNGGVFEFTLPSDILSAAAHSDRDPVRFGVSFVFFAVCAGRLEARPQIKDRVPLACVDPSSQRELGPADFVTGFVTVYSYDGVTNQNPALAGLKLGGVDVDAACTSDSDCDLPSGAAAGLSRRCNSAGRCALKLPRCTDTRCDEYLLEPKLAPQSAEHLPGGDSEIIWANFYANFGHFGAETQLLNDRTLGIIENPGSFYRAPKAMVDAADVWLTIDDQRGGTAFQHFQLEVGD